jgi:hypothetical protein
MPFYDEEFLTPCSTPQDWIPPLVSCPRLFIQYIRSCFPYLETSIHTLRTRHTVVRDFGLPKKGVNRISLPDEISISCWGRHHLVESIDRNLYDRLTNILCVLSMPISVWVCFAFCISCGGYAMHKDMQDDNECWERINVGGSFYGLMQDVSFCRSGWQCCRNLGLSSRFSARLTFYCVWIFF